MDILPAIDVKDGRVVRYAEGDALRETPYADDPLAQARAFCEQGARWLHVVDMDRAFRTSRNNDAVVSAICALAGVRVQVGGILTDPTHARELVTWGAARVVIATEIALDASRLEELVAAVDADHAALAVDVRGGAVALRGRRERPAVRADDLVGRARAMGVRAIVYRDLDRDGLLDGADLDGAARLAHGDCAVMAAGGVEGLEAIRRANALGLAGIIVGRALYENRFTLAEALACS